MRGMDSTIIIIIFTVIFLVALTFVVLIISNTKISEQLASSKNLRVAAWVAHQLTSKDYGLMDGDTKNLLDTNKVRNFPEFSRFADAPDGFRMRCYVWAGQVKDLNTGEKWEFGFDIRKFYDITPEQAAAAEAAYATLTQVASYQPILQVLVTASLIDIPRTFTIPVTLSDGSENHFGSLKVTAWRDINDCQNLEILKAIDSKIKEQRAVVVT